MTELQGLSIERLLRFLRYMLTLRPQYNDYSCQSIVKKRLKMLIDTRTKSRAYRRHQKQGLWKALRFCAFFCLDLASLATLCRGLTLLIVVTALETNADAMATIRVATFNVSMEAENYQVLNPGEDQSLNPNALKDVLMAGVHPQVRNIAEIIQRVRPDMILLNEFDHIEDKEFGVHALQKNFLNKSQNGARPIDYAFHYVAPVNTGAPSPYDLDNDGEMTATEGDAWGFGRYPGQYGMLILSRYPILFDEVRMFQLFRWKDMPGALKPIDPLSGKPWYSDAEWTEFRLASKSVWDVPIEINGAKIHLLASHPTPPVFDGDEDRNGLRNHDEIRFLADYINGERYIYDDDGHHGGLAPESSFVILGDLNASPNGGDSYNVAINQLLNHREVNSCCMAKNTFDQSAKTTNWGLQVDYVLPSKWGIKITDSGMFWPEQGGDLSRLIESRQSSSDHRLVWLDIRVEED